MNSWLARNTKVTTTFSEKMDATTITESTFQLFRLDPDRDPSQINNVTIDLSSDGLTATLNPSTRLEANKKYSARITTGATDAAGNQLAATKAWTFTTEKW